MHKGFLFCASKDKLFFDLKFSKLTDQNIGQMDTYIRLYDEQRKGEDDNPIIGLVLYSEKCEAVAKYSVLADQNNFSVQNTYPTCRVKKNCSVSCNESTKKCLKIKSRVKIR